MKTAKRVLGFALCVILLVSAFAGCQQAKPAESSAAPESSKVEEKAEEKSEAASSAVEEQSEEESSKQEAEPATETVSGELRYSWWGSEQTHNTVLAVMDRFMELYPDIKMEGEYQAADGYQQKLWTQLASGTAPDIMAIDSPWIPELHDKNMLFDLYEKSEFFDFDALDMDFTRNFLEYDGKLLGLTSGINGIGLILLKEPCEKFGIDVTQTWTWDNLLKEGARVHAEDPECYFFATNVEMLYYQVKQQLKQMTGNQVILDDGTLGFTQEQLEWCYQYIRDEYDQGVIQPIEEVMMYTETPNPRWLNGSICAELTWLTIIKHYYSGASSGLAEGLTPLAACYPCFEDRSNGTSLVRPGSSTSINAATDYADAACTFVNFLINSPETAKINVGISNYSLSKTYRTVYNDENTPSEYIKMVELNLEGAFPKENDQTTNSEFCKLMQDEVTKIVYNQMSPADCAAETVKLMNDFWAKNK